MEKVPLVDKFVTYIKLWPQQYASDQTNHKELFGQLVGKYRFFPYRQVVARESLTSLTNQGLRDWNVSIFQVAAINLWEPWLANKIFPSWPVVARWLQTSLGLCVHLHMIWHVQCCSLKSIHFYCLRCTIMVSCCAVPAWRTQGCVVKVWPSSTVPLPDQLKTSLEDYEESMCVSEFGELFDTHLRG